ncbi:ammonium transporter [Cyberlindnera jadinii NRRL Y-1542]|uniref:Ammonium transporter n=1 Tax=Cyberlindnera jadinii (strain ATCC 18201 / CBS 1600 / BCRC 20928 / JCM 3617 / NBRC 0987 / NRRL Y-1542) TaxID=983966 RepID=A0A1E4S5K5_CYBJN|nr:ammonium transporter [Cyberlindnera jadinii NRRL Y-1542]ODV74806.1 ammonium transporter [Cyberlindnera jadinii NRRL Y-1542]
MAEATSSAAASVYEQQVSTLVPADMAYVLCATVGIVVITPGISLFYGGSMRGKNLMTLIVQSYLTTGILTVQWFLFGFSLACSETSSSAIYGNFRYGALVNIHAGPLYEGGTIPAIETFTFTLFFAVCTVQIFLGAISERGRLLPSLVLAFLWTTLCYCPFAYWVWDPNGWLYNLGDLDFAGGGPVHIASGVASLWYSWFLGPRKGWKEKTLDYKPYSPVMTFIGSLLIYFPWLFFNSGTLTTVTTPRTAMIMANTQIAAGFAMSTYCIMDYFFTKKWSLTMAAEGLIVGLVFVTPACGYLEPWACAVGAMFTAICCRLTHNVNRWIGIDDSSQSFNVHGIGGIVGGIVVGVFASPYIAGLDGYTVIEGGWIFHHWKQMGYQLAAICAIVGWSSVGTVALCYIINHIPGLKMRVSEEAEEMGLDLYDLAECADPLLAMAIGPEHPKVEYFNGDELNSSADGSTSGQYELNDMGDVKRPLPEN